MDSKKRVRVIVHVLLVIAVMAFIFSHSMANRAQSTLESMGVFTFLTNILGTVGLGGGNYAASLRANHLAHEKGYACEFYLDAKEKKYMDECGAANFFGIKNNTYVTPKSTSILPSITNKSLMQLAEDLGMKVERRQIPEDELDTFEEAGACGTAAVISPISYIDDLDTGKRYNFGEKPGPISKHLYDTLRGIQYGTIEDKHGWTTVVIE